MMTNIETHKNMKTLSEIQNRVKQLFEAENFIREPRELYEPVEYALSQGGKRLRPTLLLAACDMFGGNAADAERAAIGIEVFHNFTLLHDDLMDKSPLRRGRETVYRHWNENTAILSGDTMFALAYRCFLEKPHGNLRRILDTFTQTAIGVCDGQQYDMNFETMPDVSIPDYMRMIELKTSVLLAGALKIGALYAGAGENDIRLLYDFGIGMGLSFQLQDDILDAFGNVAVFGKQTGTDIKDNKKTFLYLKALEMADAEQEEDLRRLFSTTPDDPTEKIATVLSIYDRLNIRGLAEKEVEEHFRKALGCLEGISVPKENKQVMYDIVKQLLGREL